MSDAVIRGLALVVALEEEWRIEQRTEEAMVPLLDGPRLPERQLFHSCQHPHALPPFFFVIFPQRNNI